MADRIDHAAEARDTLTEVGYPASNEGAMLHALTHATLALVEQQRIANLIALGEECVGPGRDEVGRSAELRPDVRDGLGLS